MKQKTTKKQTKKNKMPGPTPEQSNFANVEQNPSSSTFSWAFFDKQINKYRNRKVSQTKKTWWHKLLAIPEFVVNWFKVYEPRWRTALALLVLVAIVSTLFFVSSSFTHAASYTFVQTDWSGGTSGSNMIHPTNQTGWTNYSAQTNADTATAGTVKISSYTNNVSETFTSTANRDNANTTIGGVTAPTVTGYNNSNLTDTAGTETTGSVSWNSGDVVVVMGIIEDNTGQSLGTPTTTGTGLSFSLVSGFPTNTDSNTKAYAWSATASATSSGTISSVESGGASRHFIAAWVFSGSSGVGNGATVVGDTTDPYTASLTRSQANSMVVGVFSDWNAVNDTTVTATPSGATQRIATNDTGRYTSFAFNWPDQGTTGTTNYGFTGLAGGKLTGGVVEVKGSPTSIWTTSGQITSAQTISYKSTSYTKSASTTGVTATEPSGVVTGDVLIGVAYVNATGGAGAPTTPTGWTTLYTGNNPGGYISYKVAYIVRGASAPDYFWDITGTSDEEVQILAFSGVDTTNPIDSQSAKGTDYSTSAAQSPNPPSTTAISASSYAVTGGVYFTGSAAGGYTPPTNYILRSDNTVGNTIMMATRQLSASGAEDPGSFGGAATPGGTRDNWNGFTVTLNPSTLSSGQAQSLTIDTTAQNIGAATLTKNDSPGTGTVTYYLSNDGSTFNQVTPGSQYNFSTIGSDLRFRIVITGNATVQDVSISYMGYNSSADLTSSAYNTGDANNLISKLAWTATVPSNQNVQFQIRSAPDSSGSPGTWSNWCGYSDCSGSTYFNTADNNVSLASNHPLRSGGNDQWFQYKIIFTSNGINTPNVDDVTVTYVVNAPPQFDSSYPAPASSGVSVSQDTDSSSPTFGKVLINYKIRDTDSTTGTTTPGFITPTFEYNIGGGWVAITAGNLGASDLNNKAVDESNYTLYTATWNAQAQIPTNYSTSAQIRVTINDNEAANNTAQATSANFTLDTKVPAISAFTMDSSTDKLTLSATDDTNLEYRLSNNSDLSADGVNATSGQWQSAGGNSISINPSWTFTGSPSSETVYAQVRDTAGNVSSATAVAPSTPQDMDIKDISNAAADSYKLFVSWSVYVPVANAAFQKYEVYRSTDGSSYSLQSTITDVNTNYYADFTTAQGSTYYYKVRVVDTDTDVGNFSSAVSDTPNGTQPGDIAPPVISAVTVEDTQPTTATITWTTDELSDSRINYSISPSTAFGSGQANRSVVTSHSLTLTNLTPNTTYLFEVSSTDAFGNEGTNDNSNAGFSFTTGSGPVISSVTETSVGEHTATIHWTTDKNSDSFVSYSTSPTLANPVKVGSAVLVGGSAPYQHDVDLSNLTSGATYYYMVESKDAGSNNTQDDNAGNYYSFTTTTDNTGPVISNISVPVVAPTAAVVVWETDELATSQMDWGTTSGSLNNTTTLDSTLTIFHAVSINSLAEGTKYYYRVRSKDGADNETISSEGNFTTGQTTVITQVVAGGGGGGSTVVVDTTAPEISNIKVDGLTAFAAQISFDTNEDTIGIVQFGKADENLTKSAADSDYAKSHTVNLSGLVFGTEYHFKVKAIDKSGNASSSQENNFTTQFFSESTINIGDAAAFQKEIDDAIESALPSLVPPFIEKPAVTDITGNSATITWRTNVKAYSVVAYATEDEFNSASDQDKYTVEVSDTTNKVVAHQLILQNLNPNTKYHFQVKAFTLPQLVGQSSDLAFVTKALNIQAQINDIGNSSFRVAWRTADPTSSIVEYRNTKTGVLNQKALDEKVTSHEITVDGLTPATTYEVSVFGINAKGNRVETASAVKITTSQDVKPPEIQSLKIDTAIIPGRTDRTQTIVSWKTNEPSTSTVYYEEGVGTAADSNKPLSNKVEITNSFVVDHAVVLSVLKPGGLYRIQIASTDTAGNVTTLPVKTIVVPRQSESILDVVFKNFEDTFKFLREIGK